MKKTIFITMFFALLLVSFSSSLPTKICYPLNNSLIVCINETGVVGLNVTGDLTGISQGNGIIVTNGGGPVPDVAVNFSYLNNLYMNLSLGLLNDSMLSSRINSAVTNLSNLNTSLTTSITAVDTKTDNLNSTKVTVGTATCTGSQVAQNVTGNTSGLFSDCLTVSAGAGGGNTTTEIRNAVNNTGIYNITINASNVLNPPWGAGGNTTQQIRDAVNNSGIYNITVNASNIILPPWLTSYTETDPLFSAINVTIWANDTILLNLDYLLATNITNLNTSLTAQLNTLFANDTTLLTKINLVQTNVTNLNTSLTANLQANDTTLLTLLISNDTNLQSLIVLVAGNVTTLFLNDTTLLTKINSVQTNVTNLNVSLSAIDTILFANDTTLLTKIVAVQLNVTNLNSTKSGLGTAGCTGSQVVQNMTLSSGAPSVDCLTVSGGPGGGNTTEEMRFAINNTGIYNITINASNIILPPWLTSYTETDPLFSAINSTIWSNDTTLLTKLVLLSTNITNLNTSLTTNLQANDTNLQGLLVLIASNITTLFTNDTTLLTKILAVQTNVTNLNTSLQAQINTLFTNDTNLLTINNQQSTNITNLNATKYGANASVYGYLQYHQSNILLGNSLAYQNGKGIGINNTSPNATLHVSGSMIIEYDVRVGNATVNVTLYHNGSHFFINTTLPIVMPAYTGAASDYACFNAIGQLVRQDAAC